MYHNLRTTLYHGTISEISKVDVNAGRSRKDFGIKAGESGNV